MRTPVIIPLASSRLAANAVFSIIVLRDFLSNVIEFVTSIFVLKIGNSSVDIPTTLNSDVKQSITILLFSSLFISISDDGSFLIMSPNSFAVMTTEPSSTTSTSIVFFIAMSRSDADIVNFPLFTSSRIPFKTGIVVLDVTALETILSAFDSFCC